MNQGLEQALEAIERDADAAVRATAAAHAEAKRVKAAAATGQLRALRQSLEAVVRAAEHGATAARDVRDGWNFDEHAYFVSGAFTKEVLDTAAEHDLNAFESDERILSYPAIVALSAADSTVVIDKRKERKVRPSVLVRTLKALQAKPPRFRADAFIEALATAYDYVAGWRGVHAGATVKLTDIYNALTVLPGSSRDYSRQELARDLYLLDQSGVTTTKSGRRLQLPASALTRGSGVLRTVTRSGQEKVYAGISFEGARS
ncbi:MAG: hypothetical protein H0W46_10720 [Acidimicrobiia bacterium]|nr:hypothetical protein [Acidimicrobiia bacterium]